MARFVLVHGAFGGAWSWRPVIGPLEEAGHTVEAFDLPGGGEDRTPVEEITLERCVARVCEVLSSQAEPAVLVGFSMGGIVVTQAASECSQHVESLIFVAAFMPSDGQSLLDLTALPEGAGNMIQENLVVAGDPPLATLPDEAAVAGIYNRCTPEQAARAMTRRRPQAVAPLATPIHVDEEVLASIPRSYVLTKEDRSLVPPLQRRMIRDHPCERVIEIDADHAPFFSATDELVAALLTLAGSDPEGV
jgi:pimeloyl-ACP methyl ester carboxylesterase